MSAVIFGASTFGESALSSLNDRFDVEFFCDNSKEKQGTEFCGLKVIAPDELLGKDVIVASYYHLEIVKQLVGMNIKRFYIAFDNGIDKIEACFINLSIYDSLDVEKDKICLVSENNSGSNTLALKKLVGNCGYNFVLVNETHRDTNYYYDILTSYVILKTHGGSTLDSAINIQLWHGMGVKPLGYMSKLDTQAGCEAKHKAWIKLDGVFTYSQMFNLILSACFGIPINKFYITGAPRNDFLFKSDGKPILSQMVNINEDEKVILYAPTFRTNVYGHKSGLNKAYLYNIDDINLVEFNEFLKLNNYKLVVKLHFRDVEDCAEKIKELDNIVLLTDEMLYKNDLDFYEVLNAFDGLISDYSSIVTDFLLLDRPIILMPFDIEKYKEDVGIMLEPYEFWYPGEKVYNYEHLKNAMAEMFSVDRYREQRETVMSILHKYVDGESTERVLDALGKVVDGE